LLRGIFKYVKQLITFRKKQSNIFKTHKIDTKPHCTQTLGEKKIIAIIAWVNRKTKKFSEKKG